MVFPHDAATKAFSDRLPGPVSFVVGTYSCDECVQLCCDIFRPDEAFPWSVRGSRT